jgi:flavodoxin
MAFRVDSAGTKTPAEGKPMKALVVYESLFGNTEQVARAISRGLSEQCDVELCNVTEATTNIPEELALIVVGGPTHAFSMSRPSTRQDAFSQGASQGSVAIGVREWLGHQRKGPHFTLVAMFDTRVGKVRHMPGSAARGAAKFATRLGYASAAKPESFYVEDVTGPLADGELARAQSWGRQLGAMAASRVHERPK